MDQTSVAKAVVLFGCPGVTSPGKVMDHEHSAVTGDLRASFATPCSQDIDRVQTTIDAKLEAQAAAGRPARESTAATMHRQPTPGSIAAAEVNLGDISAEKIQAVETLIMRAREADRANDSSACEQALAEVQRVLN